MHWKIHTSECSKVAAIASAKLPHTSWQHPASAHALTWVYVSRISQLPTDVCPQFQHKWDVSIESASIATTCTYNCKIEWSSVFHVSLSCRQACVHNLNTNEMLISNLHLLLRHVLAIAKLNEAKCFTSLSAADKRVSTIWTHIKCWCRICIYCYDMYLQLQNWMKLSVRQACVQNLNTNQMLISNLHLLLRHVLTIAKLNEAKCFTIFPSHVWKTSNAISK